MFDQELWNYLQKLQVPPSNEQSSEADALFSDELFSIPVLLEIFSQSCTREKPWLTV